MRWSGRSISRWRASPALHIVVATTLVAAGCRSADEQRPPEVVVRLEPTEPTIGPHAEVGSVPVTAGVRALDAQGAPVCGVTVAWAAELGAVTATSTRTDGQGVARTSWNPGTRADAGRLRATVPGSAARDFEFHVIASPGPVARLTPEVQTVGIPLVAGNGVRLIAYRSDRYGDMRPPVPVRFTSSDQTVVRVDSLNVSNSAGALRSAPGTATITATAEGAQGSATLRVAARASSLDMPSGARERTTDRSAPRLARTGIGRPRMGARRRDVLRMRLTAARW